MTKLFLLALLFALFSSLTLAQDDSHFTTSLTHYTRDIGGQQFALDFSYYQLDESNLEDVPVWLRRYYTRRPFYDIHYSYSETTAGQTSISNTMSFKGGVFIKPKLEWSSKAISDKVSYSGTSDFSWFGTGLNYYIGNENQITLGVKYNMLKGYFKDQTPPLNIELTNQTLTFNLRLLLGNKLRLEYTQIDEIYVTYVSPSFFIFHRDEVSLEFCITPSLYIKYTQWLHSNDILVDGSDSMPEGEYNKFREVGFGYSFNNNLDIEAEINLDEFWAGNTKNDFSITLNYRF